MASSEMEDKPFRLYPSIRLCMFLLVLLGCTALGGGFGAFNFAIVCMVNETSITESAEPARNWSKHAQVPEQCARFDSTDQSEPNGGYTGEFAWDKATQAHLLAAHAFGAILPNIPSGLLSDRYGARWIFATCVLTSGLACAVTPAAAYAGVPWLFFARFLQGAGSGGSWPCVLSLLSRWGTPLEAATLIVLGGLGYQFGPLIAMGTSSYICDSTYGWPLIFYLWAGVSLLFLILWFIFFTDDPSENRFISSKELSYITKHNIRKGRKSQSLKRVPWKRILLCPCVLAVYVTQFGSTFSNFYIGEFMPTYSKEVLYFDVRSNGFTSALPSFAQCMGRVISAPLADKLTFGGRSKTFAVKIFTVFCTFLPALSFFTLGFLDCRQTVLAVVCFFTAALGLSTGSVGYARGGVFMAARYAGLIGSISNLYAYFAAIVMPYIVGAMVQHGSVHEWRNTAFVVASVMAFTGAFYQIFGSAEEQKWAIEDKPKRADKIYVVDAKPIGVHDVEKV